MLDEVPTPWGLLVNLREYREQKGWRQADLAAAARVTPSMVSRYERHRAIPGVDTFLRIAAAFGLRAVLEAGPADPRSQIRR